MQRLRDESQNDIEVRLANLSSFEIKLMWWNWKQTKTWHVNIHFVFQPQGQKVSEGMNERMKEWTKLNKLE